MTTNRRSTTPHWPDGPRANLIIDSAVTVSPTTGRHGWPISFAISPPRSKRKDQPPSSAAMSTETRWVFSGSMEAAHERHER